MGAFLEMTSLSCFKRPLLACLAALTIAGCSNTGSELNLRQTFKSLFARDSGQAAPAQVDVAQLLKQTAPTSLVHVNLKDRGNISAFCCKSNRMAVFAPIPPRPSKPLPCAMG
jgi:hypothetical protein